MSSNDHERSIVAGAADYDAVIVGASLAGCATAILLGRAGARVALVEKQPDMQAFKRVCGHFLQSSAVPTLRRLGLLAPIAAVGGVRSRLRLWTRWGWIVAPEDPAALAVNVRREQLDPLVREMAAATPGVELILARAAHQLARRDGAVCGVAVHDRNGGETVLRAQLVVGADGRDSRIAELAGAQTRTTRHERFAYAAYFEGGAPAHSPDASVWFLDPQWIAAFPTDGDLTLYGVMLTKDRLPEFKRDPAAALVDFIANVPEAPPIRDARMVSPVIGKLDMPNRMRTPVAPGLALVGDAALAADPLWGVGCGWAFQSAEWLADSVQPALLGAEPLARGLARYRRRHALRLRGHAYVMSDYAGGRRLNAGERLAFAAATRDAKLASAFDAFGSRRVGPGRILTTLPRTMAVNARHALSARRGTGDGLLGEAARA